MKQELQRVKNENGDLRKKVEKIRADGESSKRGTPEMPAEWENEREKLVRQVEEVQTTLKSSVSDLESKITTMQGQLQSAEADLEQSRGHHETSSRDLTALQATHSQTRSDIERLQQENASLEERARDAENKVQLLLDQVEHSVDNYRRQSRISENATPVPNGTSSHHTRNMSDISTSTAGAPHYGHNRSQSEGNESLYSTNDTQSVAGTENGRNSLALDSLASELETLRSHWQTTNKAYRLSDRFDFEHTPTSATKPGHMSEYTGSSLANWRKGLDLVEDEDEEGKGGQAGSNGAAGPRPDTANRV
jgi:DNA repair exonuclease SbcCD ATPase subunit